MGANDINMDADVKKELEQIENRLETVLLKTINNLIKDGMADIKQTISELFNKDVEYINSNLRRQEEHINSHDADIKKLWKALDVTKNSINHGIENKIAPIMRDIDELKEKTIQMSVSHDTADKIEEKQDRKKEITNSTIGVIIAIATTIGGIIGFVVTILIT